MIFSGGYAMKRMTHQSFSMLPGMLCLLFPAVLHSQTITVDPPQTVPVNALTVNDLDFMNATTPKLLFIITMHADGTVQAEMTITIDAILADGSSFPAAVYLETDPFEIDNYKVISNLDLVNENPHVGEYTVRQDAKRRLEETALPGGRVPAGIYRFLVGVTPVGGGSGATAEFTIEPTNPTSLELRFPMDGAESPTEFPYFEWNYDGARARLSIFEQLPGQSSPEETASGVPHLSETVGTNSFQYPSAGARPLSPGKTYAWFVEGLSTMSGGGEVGLKSEIRSFHLPLPGAGSLTSNFLEELERALGPRHRDVFDQIRSEGMIPEGSMSLDGSALPQSELVRLLNIFRSNPDAVHSVYVE